ncbi:hypothetical protein JW899_00070 [Candidatus Uhrbacteria bacterium]|nr:hypothetical protein [Candidatus Uhrbacteria bacterium]
MDKQKILAVVVSAMVVAVVIYGMVLAGSPDTARNLQFDAQRLDSLRQVSQAVERHYLNHGQLPSGLGDIAGDYGPDFRDFLRDPVSGEPYEYVPAEGNGYRLCAVFYADFSEQKDGSGRYASPPAYFGEKAAVDPFLAGYRAGRSCFSLKAGVSGSCRLMVNVTKDGEYGCFGCSNGVCNSAPANWKRYEPVPGMPDPFVCVSGPVGCEMTGIK